MTKHKTRYEANRLKTRNRVGPLLVDAKPTRLLIERAAVARISDADIAGRAGVSQRHVYATRTGRHPLVQRSWAERVHRAVGTLLEDRREALDDVAATLQHLCIPPVTDRHRWSSRQVVEFQRARGGRLHLFVSEGDRCYLYRNALLDTARADRIAIALGVMPHDIWPDWEDC